MRRPCNTCGRAYEARRPSSKYCSDTCRKRAQRARGGTAWPGAKARKPAESTAGEQSSPLVASVIQELTDAGRLQSSAGQRALHLAHQLAAPRMESGSGVAALDKQLAAAMAQALDGVARVADTLDELGARRARRRA